MAKENAGGLDTAKAAVMRLFGRRPTEAPAEAPPAASAPPAPVSETLPPAPPEPAAAAPAAATPPAAPAPATPPAETPAGGATVWLNRLRQGLAKSSNRLSEGLATVFLKKQLDDQTLHEFEELLIAADLGPATAARLTTELARGRFGSQVTLAEVKTWLAEQITPILAPVARPLVPDPAIRPFVVLVVGVNGTGKTTTIGKLALQWRNAGRRVLVVAGDTFRAAAIEQLKIWAERAGVPLIAGAQGADAAGLAFDGLARAKAEGADVLVIDTAGRLQNKDHLMAELQKIIRVLKKQDPAAPHATLLVLDATTGQNAHAQVAAFSEMVAVTGLIVTKLDGSARGGVLVALADRFKLPVHAIGIGEGIDDLRPFAPDQFARSLVGL